MESIVSDIIHSARNAVNSVGGELDVEKIEFLLQDSIDNVKESQLMFLALVDQPRVIEYEFGYQIPIISILEEDLNRMFKNNEFSRNWIMSFPRDGVIVYTIHILSVDEYEGEFYNGNSFYQFYLEGSDICELSLCSFITVDNKMFIVSDDKGMNIDALNLALSYWKMFFEINKKNIAIKSSKKRSGHNKGKVFNKDEPMVQYISLTKEGQRYVQLQKKSVTGIFKDGKTTIDVVVDSFVRKQWVGHGNEKHCELRQIKSFERKQWIVPRDKVVKITD